MSLFWIAILFLVFQPSYQKRYLCNPTLECGCSTKPVSFARIVGGEEANEGTWSWMVSLSIIIGKDNTLCGGSIISSSWIITAAHCVYNVSPSVITVYAGSNIIWSGTQNRSVLQIIVHSEYNTDNYVNDISLLKLTTPLDMDDPAVGLICLPSVDSKTLVAGEWPTLETSVVAVGWGALEEGGEVSDDLQQVALRPIDYRSPRCNLTIEEKQVQFCAGVENGEKDTCQGDSGGPLMMFTSNKQWILVGLTSSGEGCARRTSSGTYTRVAAFEEWINVFTDGAYSKPKDVPDLPNYFINSTANTISTWNYFIFLPSLFVYFFNIALRCVV